MMRTKRTVAGVATATMILAGLGVAGAMSATAADQGDLLPGDVFFLTNGARLASATPADQVTGGTYLPDNPFDTVTANGSCPAGTVQTQVYTRLKNTQPEEFWDETAMGGARPYQTDAAGNVYVTGPFDNFDLAAIQNHLGGATKTLPVALVCKDSMATPLGYFQTELTLVPGVGLDGSWSQVDAPSLPRLAPTMGALEGVPASIEQGDSMTVTGSVQVSGADPTGTIAIQVNGVAVGSAPVSYNAALDRWEATITTSPITSVGDVSVTAVYSGDATYAPATSAPVSLQVTPVAPRATTLSDFTVSPVDGAAFTQLVTLSVAVSADQGSPVGKVEFYDNGAKVGEVTSAVGGVWSLTKNGFAAGDHVFSATFVGTAPYTDSQVDLTNQVAAHYELEGATDEQTVTVDIPSGSITITTPYTPDNPLHLGTAVLDPSTSTYHASASFGNPDDPAAFDFGGIKITDTRAGNLGFTAKVQSGDFSNGTDSFGGDHAGLWDLYAFQVPGNALQHTDVTTYNTLPQAPGLGTAQVFATYPSGLATGTAQLYGTFGVAGVPSSVSMGTYTATVIFTAL